MKESKSTDRLFADFSTVDKQQWKQKATEDLKGGDYDKKLVWHTDDQFNVDPYYTRGENESLGYLRQHAGMASQQAGTQGARYWLNVMEATGRSADQQVKSAMTALESGADGLYFDLDDNPEVNVADLIVQLRPLKCYSVYNIDEAAAQALLRNDGSQWHDPGDRGALSFDPIQRRTLTGQWNDRSMAILADLTEALNPDREFRSITIHSKHLHDSGATASVEIAYTLSIMVDIIERLSGLGVKVADIIDNLRFEVAVGTSYFMEIAKLKALRILASTILEKYTGSAVAQDRLFLHANSSLWSKTVFDPYVNMLRNTTEAMSAILGGCDALTLSPHDVRYQQQEDFSRRIAKNISIILKEESYFDKTADPSAGSYYVEQLVDKLIQRGLTLFQETEQQGGFMASFEAGLVQKKLTEARRDEDRKLARRKKVFVGSNQYPNTSESVDPKQVRNDEGRQKVVAGVELLQPRSGAATIEALRLKTERWIKKSGGPRPRVYLSLIGQNASMRAARSTFSSNFLGCGGFEIKQGTPASDVESAAGQAVQTAAEITVLCGADVDYTDHGARYAKIFKAGHNRGILIMAGHPGDNEAAFKSAGFDGFIHMRADLAETLSAIQNKLDIKAS